MDEMLLDLGAAGAESNPSPCKVWPATCLDKLVVTRWIDCSDYVSVDLLIAQICWGRCDKSVRGRGRRKCVPAIIPRTYFGRRSTLHVCVFGL